MCTPGSNTALVMTYVTTAVYGFISYAKLVVARSRRNSYACDTMTTIVDTSSMFRHPSPSKPMAMRHHGHAHAMAWAMLNLKP